MVGMLIYLFKMMLKVVYGDMCYNCSVPCDLYNMQENDGINDKEPMQYIVLTLKVKLQVPKDVVPSSVMVV
jgi:hypothetical protein